MVVLMLIAALAANTFVGLYRLAGIEFELEGVAKKDVVLLELAGSIARRHLERGILLERMIRISEELSFQETSPARRNHLTMNVKITKDGFEDLAQKGALEIIQAKKLVEELRTNPRFALVHKDLDKAAALILGIEHAHIEYDRAVLDIMEQILQGRYELSFEDIDRVQKKERRLNKNLQTLLDSVQGFVTSSLARARLAQEQAVWILWQCLAAGTILGLIFLLMIIRGIARPLKILVGAANRLAGGEYDLHVSAGGRDEFGKLSRAFNHMSEKISQANRELQQKNAALDENLKTTHRQKRDLQRMNRDLDELVKVLSHDIRSPLTTLTGYGTVLQKEYLNQLDEKGQRCVMGIKRGTDRITTMIDDLLAMKQIVNQEIRWEKTNIEELLLSVKKRLHYKISEHKAVLDFQGPFPVIACDATKTGIVFLNLLNNAIKFSSKDPAALPRIEITYRPKDDAHEFVVKDNGIGIDPKYHEEIFGLFRRVDAAGDSEGSGVGLTVVKAIIEEHGGKIWVESRSGEGAAFHFTIPKYV